MAQTKHIFALYRSPQYLAVLAMIHMIAGVCIQQLSLPVAWSLTLIAVIVMHFAFLGVQWWVRHIQAMAISGDKLEVCMPQVVAANDQGWVELHLERIQVFSLMVRVVGKLPSGQRLVLSLFNDSLAPAANARFRRWAIDHSPTKTC